MVGTIDEAECPARPAKVPRERHMTVIYADSRGCTAIRPVASATVLSNVPH